MTLKSNWSIASDDDNSRHSFLSDCDSEFDLSPPPRYPAEKRSFSKLNKLSMSRHEPPMTRSRAKAIQRTMLIPQSLPKEQRQSNLRGHIDPFTDMASSLTNTLDNNSILFPKQELINDRSDIHRSFNSPVDGVNTLTDWLESCSLDESKLNKNCRWPSRETNSHYMRPITSLIPSNVTFGSNPFSMLQTSPLFVQSSSMTTGTTALFGQQQAQLWSRFRFAASTIRDNLWVEHVDSSSSSHLPNRFTNSNSPFNLSDPSSNAFFSSSPSQIVPTKSNPIPSSSSSPLLRHRQTPLSTNAQPSTSSTSTKLDDITIHKSSSKLFFTLMIFALGLVLGYLLTTTFPPSLLLHWFIFICDLCVQLSLKSVQMLFAYVQTVLEYISSLTLP